MTTGLRRPRRPVPLLSSRKSAWSRACCSCARKHKRKHKLALIRTPVSARVARAARRGVTAACWHARSDSCERVRASRFQQQQQQALQNSLSKNLSKWVRDCLRDYSTLQACQHSLASFFQLQQQRLTDDAPAPVPAPAQPSAAAASAAKVDAGGSTPRGEAEGRPVKASMGAHQATPVGYGGACREPGAAGGCRVHAAAASLLDAVDRESSRAHVSSRGVAPSPAAAAAASEGRGLAAGASASTPMSVMSVELARLACLCGQPLVGVSTAPQVHLPPFSSLLSLSLSLYLSRQSSRAVPPFHPKRFHVGANCRAIHCHAAVAMCLGVTGAARGGRAAAGLRLARARQHSRPRSDAPASRCRLSSRARRRDAGPAPTRRGVSHRRRACWAPPWGARSRGGCRGSGGGLWGEGAHGRRVVC